MNFGGQAGIGLTVSPQVCCRLLFFFPHHVLLWWFPREVNLHCIMASGCCDEQEVFRTVNFSTDWRPYSVSDARLQPLPRPKNPSPPPNCMPSLMRQIRAICNPSAPNYSDSLVHCYGADDECFFEGWFLLNISIICQSVFKELIDWKEYFGVGHHDSTWCAGTPWKTL